MAVIKVNDAELPAELQSSEKVAIKFYADWCGSCKLFAPKYKRISEDPQFSGIKFLEINAEENPEARKLAGVDNLPFFAVFKNGEMLAGVATSKEEKVTELLHQVQ